MHRDEKSGRSPRGGGLIYSSCGPSAESALGVHVRARPWQEIAPGGWPISASHATGNGNGTNKHKEDDALLSRPRLSPLLPWIYLQCRLAQVPARLSRSPTAAEGAMAKDFLSGLVRRVQVGFECACHVLPKLVIMHCAEATSTELEIGDPPAARAVAASIVTA